MVRVNATKLYTVYGKDGVEVALQIPNGAPPTNLTKWYWAARHAGADAKMICPSRHAAMSLAALKGVHTWIYLFAHTPNHGEPHASYIQGAFHASDVPFLFHVVNASVGPQPEHFQLNGADEIALSRSMVRYWRNFAATGNPNDHSNQDQQSLPFWPAYNKAVDDTWMIFGRMDGSDDHGIPIASRGVKSHVCDFWVRDQYVSEIRSHNTCNI